MTSLLAGERIPARQISHLERQRSQIDTAINTLREAHRRLPESSRQGAGLPERSGE